MGNKINLKSIAKQFNVSITTVSLALKGDKSISEELRIKINNYAQEQGYKALSLRRSNLGCIAVIIPIETSSIKSWGLFTEIIQSFEIDLRKKGYRILLFPTNKKIPQEHLLQNFFLLPIEAIISVHFAHPELLKQLQKNNYPVVIINNSLIEENPEIPENNFVSILVDDIQGAFDACNRLIENRHRSILYVDYLREDLPHIMIDRKLGVEKAILLNNENLTLFHERLTHITKEQIDKVLEKHISKVSAILVHDDFIGKLLYDSLKTFGEKTQEISFLSMGGIHREIPMEFSSYQIEGKKIGKIAAEEIVKLIEKREKISLEQLEPHLFKVRQVYIDRNTVKRHIN